MHQRTANDLHEALIQQQDFVRRLALRLTRHPAEADDVAQDVWVRALERAPSGGPPPSRDREGRGLRPWLQAAVRGVSRNRDRAARRRRFHEQSGARDECQPFSDLELRHEVVRAVLGLKEPYRSTVVRRYDQGMSVPEIAQVDGVVPGTVRTRLHRAHQELQRRLCADDESRGRLSALAAATPALPLASVQGIGAALAVAGALAAGLLLGWLPSPWADLGRPADRGAHAAVPSGHARGPVALAGLGPMGARGLLAPAEQPEERVALLAEEHPYWTAVREARAGIPRYVIDEPEAERALRTRVESLGVEPPTWTPGEPLGTTLTRLSSAAAVPIVVAKGAARATTPSDPRWLVRPTKVSFAGWLALTLGLAEGRPRWEVADGAVQVADLGELMEHAVDFEYRLEDLRLDPVPYFEDGAVPPPLYRTARSGTDGLVHELGDALGDLHRWDQGDRVTAEPDALLVRHLPRAQLRAQALLDRLRAFRLPLPGAGVPGGTSRSASSGPDRRAASLVRALGGVRALARMDTGALTARLTAAGKERGVGVLWTAGARDLLSRPGPSAGLTFEVLGGCVCVLAEEEVESSAKEVLWMDLRETLDGGEFDPATLAAYPELAALAPTPGAPTRSPSLAQAYLSQHVARETWDQDPAFSIRMTAELQLVVVQTPWVLDEIEGHMTAWKGE
ncbi:sigma-70 family RNA polymerase sigma factor [bacterium]|nr:sigma-70 family RNA polymerase sigma factor [bacterium]